MLRLCQADLKMLNIKPYTNIQEYPTKYDILM